MCIPTWKKANGIRIKISDMETEHIKNSITMMKRNGYISKKHWNIMFGPGPNGDMAQLSFQNEFEYMIENKRPNQLIDYLERELERRGE